jgi:hypothetical protein
MAMRKRARSGRFMKSNSAPRRRRRSTTRRRARRNYYGAGMLANRPRRRRRSVSRRRSAVARMNPRRRRSRSRSIFRSNPRKIFGFEMPPLDAVLFTGVGLIVPNQVAGYLMGFLPTSITKNADGTTSQPVSWLVKVASVLLPSLAVRKFVSPRAGNFMLVGGASGLVLDAIKTFMPGVIPGLGYQPLLGEYVSPGLSGYFDRPTGVVPYRRPSSGLTPILQNTPDRLSPAGRF